MKRLLLSCMVTLLLLLLAVQATWAQKQGGILKLYDPDSPASLSIHEEVAVQATGPMMAVFNNLVLYDQHVAQNGLASIVPELAVSWSWSDDRKTLTFKLRDGVTWHDGAPFTAKDVQCTWDLLLGRSAVKFRANPRKSWYGNLEDVAVDTDNTVRFRLTRPQPSLLALLASGLSPIYPCHVPPAEMRQHPIGTGPFKFLQFKPNESIKLTRNQKYWKEGLPYLDAIEYTVIPNRATQLLAFISGKVDMSFLGNMTIPLVNEVTNQAQKAICEVQPAGLARSLLLNRTTAPFDNKEIRRAVALALDRQAFVDVLSEGKDEIGGIMTPPPEGVWGMPPDMLSRLPGYGPDIDENRAEARRLMQKLGYDANRPLKITFITRNLPEFRDTAVLVIDQLKQVYIAAELELVETAQWFSRLARRDYQIGFIFSITAVDDPDQLLYENYTCGAERNYIGYCDREMERWFERQSTEADQTRRRELVWQIERDLAEDAVRPIIAHVRRGTCWQPIVKGLTIMRNSIYNGWRFEDVWLGE